MAASNTDKITDVRNAARPNSARVSSGRSTGGATLACDNLTGWPTASKVHFVTYQIDSNSNPVAGTQLDCYGIRSGNNITSLVVVDGTDAGNQVNDVVEMLPTAAWGQDLADALTTAHDRLGVHKAGAIYPTPTLTTPTIADFTAATHDHSATSKGGQLSSTAFATGGLNTTALHNPYKFSVYLSANQTVNTGTTAIIGFDTREYDTGSNVDIVTNKGRFTAPIPGFYQFNFNVQSTESGGSLNQALLYKNGSIFKNGTAGIQGAGTSTYDHSGGTSLQLAANDYIEITWTNTTGGSKNVTGGQSTTYFSGFLISAT